MCECLTGFVPNYSDGFACEDYNECANNCNNDCDSERAICINLAGSFECICHLGFDGNGKIDQCLDINECKEMSYWPANRDQCSPHSECTNTIGGFKCHCISGFSGNGTTCSDVNECIDLELEKECQLKNSKCINQIGSYECKCLDGYRADFLQPNNCIDIDECRDEFGVQKSLICADNTVCTNIPGSFICQCNSGFRWSSSRHICEDIDECTIRSKDFQDNYSHGLSYSTSVCDNNSICVNTVGSFKCDCKSGWNKTNHNDYCSDVNECRDNSSIIRCSNNSICHNLQGSYECNCFEGFMALGSNMTCLDINECDKEHNICTDAYHQCINTIGSYKCQCIIGFVTDINGVCIG